MHRTPISAIPNAPPSIRNLARGRSIHDTSSSPEARVYALGAEGPGGNALYAKTCLCSIRDCGFSHVKVSGLVMGACRPLLQGLV